MARNGINWPKKKLFKLAEMARNGLKWPKWQIIVLNSTYKDCIDNPQILKSQWS